MRRSTLLKLLYTPHFAIHLLWLGLPIWLMSPALLQAQDACPPLIVNEGSNGESGSKEFFELVVVGCPGTTRDLRNVIIDDNSGLGACASGQGIAPGHYRFTDNPQWAGVPTGTMIVIYNADDPNASLPPDDLNDSNGDLVYIIPNNQTSFVEGYDHLPDPNTNQCHTFEPLDPTRRSTTWPSTLGMNNSYDVCLVVDPANTDRIHGFSYGNLTPIPDIPFLGTANLANQAAQFVHTDPTDPNNPYLTSNWGRVSWTQESPGQPNNPANAAWINALKSPSPQDPDITITTAPDPPIICEGEQITLTADSEVSHTYTWAPAGPLLDPNTNPTVDARPLTTTTFTVTGNFGCCRTQQNVTVQVTNINVTASASPATLCVGETVALSASGATNYTWAPAAGVNPTAPDGSTAEAAPAATTTYTVTGTRSGCTAEDEVEVTVSNALNITASASPDRLCEGLSTVLNASGAAIYTWSPDSSLSSPNGPSVVATPPTTTTYTVTGANAAGTCTGTQTVAVTVDPRFSVSLTATPPASVCLGAAIDLTASSPEPGITYRWDPPTLTVTNPPPGGPGDQATATPNVTTTYRVYGEKGACSGTNAISASVTVPVNPLNVVARAEPNEICPGEEVLLIAENASRYSWSPATDLDATTGDTVRFTAPFHPDGDPQMITYTVTGVSGTTPPCTDTAMVVIQVLPSPNLTVTATPSWTVEGGRVRLRAEGAPNVTWSPDKSLLQTEGRSVVAEPETSTTYTATATHISGCSASGEVQVDVTPAQLTISNVFTPNADGLNDTWIYGFNPDAVTDFEMRVFNRWGQEIFSSTNPREAWDGRFNGSAVPEGVYIYKMRYRLDLPNMPLMDTDLQLVGNVSVIR